VIQAYSKKQRALEYLSIGFFFLLASWSIWRLAAEVEGQMIQVLLITLPLSWLASDLLSGFLHWALDSLGSVKTPIVGQSFIRPFREHHLDPKEMTRHDFVETHGSSCFAALPFLLASSLMGLDSDGSQLFQGFLITIALAALATNQCHKWAHMDTDSVPGLVRWAQQIHLFLPPSHHQLHHRAPYNTHFCMSNGLLNPLFNRYLRLWR
jgi:ubiquitin-conjugating enzyme E2 variant